MKKIFLAVAMMAMGLLVMTPVASAYPVSVGDQIKITQGIGGANGGGAFNIDGNLFDTFCLERNEYIAFGGSYYIGSITDEAMNGGLSGQTTPGHDLISSETAYLYSRWATGAISHNADNANALQLTIWRFEDEWADGTSNALPKDWNSTTDQQVILARSFYQQASNINHNESLYGVAVINLYNSYNRQTLKYEGNAQDLLVYNAVPEPTTMLLLGLGLIGLSGVRRIAKRK